MQDLDRAWFKVERLEHLLASKEADLNRQKAEVVLTVVKKLELIKLKRAEPV